MRYVISGFFSPDIQLEILDSPPPCLNCGRPVDRLSTDGPLVCVPCDLGQRPDGTPLTDEDYRAQSEHRRQYIEKYRVV